MTSFFFFFFNDTATTEIYTLSLHDALPICGAASAIGRTRIPAPSRLRSHTITPGVVRPVIPIFTPARVTTTWEDRKSTRLNSSHGYISYAVFCLKKKKKKTTEDM